jgi:hypothetical protein
MRRGAESACRAVGFAEADPAGIADFAPSPPLATSAKDAENRYGSGVRMDATPMAQRVFNALGLKVPTT